VLIGFVTGPSWCFAQSSDALAEASTWLRGAPHQTETPAENPLQRPSTSCASRPSRVGVRCAELLDRAGL